MQQTCQRFELFKSQISDFHFLQYLGPINYSLANHVQ